MQLSSDMPPTLTLRPNRKWTELEQQQLRALLEAGASVEKVARKLKRTEAAIRVQAFKMRVSASNNLAQRRKRTADLQERT